MHFVFQLLFPYSEKHPFSWNSLPVILLFLWDAYEYTDTNIQNNPGKQIRKHSPYSDIL